MPSQKVSTMKDVALLAKVSIQTVSAVINGKPGITPETSDRVKKAVLDLNYHPYPGARSLRTRQTNTIALIVADINNPSFAAIASAAEDVAHSNGYNLVLFNTHNDTQREFNYINKASQQWMDGVILVATGDQLTDLDSLEKAGIPIVFLERIPFGYLGPSVTMNNYKTGNIAAEHLLELGHKKIAQIVGPQRLRIACERSDGFISGLKSAGLVTEGLVSVEGDWSCESGYRAMQLIMKGYEIPTAVFVANDRMAIGAMQAIIDKGIRIPEDISVIGVDDIEVSSFQSPSLTTIRQPFEQMASQSVDLLIDCISGKEPEIIQIIIEPELFLRKSTSSIR